MILKEICLNREVIIHPIIDQAFVDACYTHFKKYVGTMNWGKFLVIFLVLVVLRVTLMIQVKEE